MDLVVGEGMDARPVSIDIEPFTLVGATTRAGSLSKPMLDRFPITLRLDYYSVEELEPIVREAASKKELDLGSAVPRVASKCRGTPRIVGRLISRIRDFSVAHPELSKEDLVDLAFEKLGIGNLGLDGEDLRYMRFLERAGRPVGLSTIAAGISETPESIEDVIEPFLLRSGLISRTSRGRQLTDEGLAYLALEHGPMEKDAVSVGFLDAPLVSDPIAS